MPPVRSYERTKASQMARRPVFFNSVKFDTRLVCDCGDELPLHGGRTAYASRRHARTAAVRPARGKARYFQEVGTTTAVMRAAARPAPTEKGRISMIRTRRSARVGCDDGVFRDIGLGRRSLHSAPAPTRAARDLIGRVRSRPAARWRSVRPSSPENERIDDVHGAACGRRELPALNCSRDAIAHGLRSQSVFLELQIADGTVHVNGPSDFDQAGE